MYELHSGEDTTDAEFYELETWLFYKALEILQTEGKAQIFKGQTSDDDGVKFFAGKAWGNVAFKYIRV